MTHEEKFRAAEATGQDGHFARSDDSHPVGIFLGLDHGRRAMMVICGERPAAPLSFATIATEVRPRQDGHWALVIRLERSDLKSLFTSLVVDLERATHAHPTDAGQTIVERLALWHRLLSRDSGALLGEHELRGLLAELRFLETEAIPTLGAQNALWA